VTELVKYSVNFRGELEQLLGMLRAAETDTAHSISVVERQIEEAAKVRECESACGVLLLLCIAVSHTYACVVLSTARECGT
jgi:hypothetical protein